MHAVFILNSSAGSSGHGDLQRRIAETCAKTGTEHELVTCDRGDCIRDAARRALKSGAGLIVAAGGDGTISTVASVIAGSGVPLGVIPCGTLNHFAKDAGIPVDEELAIRTILTGTACDVDAAEVNGRIFLNNCSIGLYAHIVEQRTAGQNRGLAKWWAFVRAILDVLWRYPTIHVEVRAVGEELRCTTPLVFIGNNLYEFEGLQAGTRKRLDSRELCVVIARQSSRKKFLWSSLRALFTGVRAAPEFEYLAAEAVVVRGPGKRVRVALDGEVTVLQSPLHYRTRPGILRVMLPRASDKAA